MYFLIIDNMVAADDGGCNMQAVIMMRLEAFVIDSYFILVGPMSMALFD